MFQKYFYIKESQFWAFLKTWWSTEVSRTKIQADGEISSGVYQALWPVKDDLMGSDNRQTEYRIRYSLN